MQGEINLTRNLWKTVFWVGCHLMSEPHPLHWTCRSKWPSFIGLLNLQFVSDKWFYARLSWVPSDCIHSHFGSVGLIASEWFHTRSSWVPSDHSHSCSGPDLAWQWVSDFMPGPAMYLLIILTITLVLLAWQPVSDFMLGSAGCLLTVFTPTLVLLAWQQVSNFMSGPAGCLQSDCPHSHPGSVGSTDCEWFCASPASGYLLTVLTPTLILLAWQQVSDFIPGLAKCLLTWLNRNLWVISHQA